MDNQAEADNMSEDHNQDGSNSYERKRKEKSSNIEETNERKNKSKQKFARITNYAFPQRIGPPVRTSRMAYAKAAGNEESSEDDQDEFVPNAAFNFEGISADIVDEWIQDTVTANAGLLKMQFATCLKQQTQQAEVNVGNLGKELKELNSDYKKYILESNKRISEVQNSIEHLLDEHKKNLSGTRSDEVDNPKAALKLQDPIYIKSDIMKLKVELAKVESKRAGDKVMLTIARQQSEMLKEWIHTQLLEQNDVKFNKNVQTWKKHKLELFRNFMDEMGFDDIQSSDSEQEGGSVGNQKDDMKYNG